MTNGKCALCKYDKRVYEIRNGFLICPRCGVITAKNAYDGLAHRPTFSYVDTSLRQLTESITQAVGKINLRLASIEQDLTLLKTRADITPATTSQADAIRDLLRTEPGLSIRQIQQRTGFEADTIRKVLRRDKRRDL